MPNTISPDQVQLINEATPVSSLDNVFFLIGWQGTSEGYAPLICLSSSQLRSYIQNLISEGAAGADGKGLPAGGSKGQYLKKRSSADYDCEWVDAPTPEYAQETETRRIRSCHRKIVTDELNSINGILNEQYSKIASFTASPSVVEKGIGAQSIKLSWRTTFNDQSITPDSLSVKKSTSETPLTTDKTLTTVTDSASADTTYMLEAVIKGVTKTATAYARFYYPQFAGASASESLASADVLALGNKVVAASVARTVTVQVEQGQYFWFAVPENFTITSIKMGGFDVSLNDVATVAVDGRGNYKCYRSAKPQSAGSYTFEIK